MFNPFRRKKAFPVGWLWAMTVIAVVAGLSAWVVVNAQWRLASGLQAKYDAERRLNNELSTQLHGMKQYEGMSVGKARPSCGTLAQIGAYVGDPATAAVSVLEALKKRDPAITAADLGPIETPFYASANFGAVPDEKVPGLAVRLADGSLNWLDGSVVRLNGIFEVNLAADYLSRRADRLCGETVDRPELTQCIPYYVTLMNGGVYIGEFLPGCDAQTKPDAAMNQ